MQLDEDDDEVVDEIQDPEEIMKEFERQRKRVKNILRQVETGKIREVFPTKQNRQQIKKNFYARGYFRRMLDLRKLKDEIKVRLREYEKDEEQTESSVNGPRMTTQNVPHSKPVQSAVSFESEEEE